MEKDSSNKHPNLHIFECFNDLILLVVSVLHTGLIGLETLNSNDALAFSEKICRVWRVRKNPPQTTSEANGNDAELKRLESFVTKRGSSSLQ